MSKVIAAITTDQDHWVRLKRLFALSGMDMQLFTGLDDFLKKNLLPQETLVLIDADLNIDAHPKLISGLAADVYAGVITVSAEISPSERVALMSVGIDYCLVHPVDSQELHAIARNMFRRSRQQAQHSSDRKLNSWMLDLSQWNLKTPMGHDIGLSASERSVLAALFREPGKALPRGTIRACLKQSRDCEGRSLDVLISRLRRKVEVTSSMKLPVHSARGTGYVFTSSATIVSP